MKYDMKDGSKRDIYSVILKILADNPPLIELNLNELTERIQNNVQNAKITTRKLRDSLKNWQKLIEEQGALYQVFEWKDDKLHISDNLFLFYIRWSEV